MQDEQQINQNPGQEINPEKGVNQNQNVEMNEDMNEEMNQEEQAQINKTYQDIIEGQQKKTGTVNKKDFEIKTVIGKGSYGKVMLVKKKDNGQLYAMKVLKKAEIIKRN